MEDLHTPPHEKIVIIHFPQVRRVMSRARLLATAETATWPPETEALTDTGKSLLPLVSNIDGIEIPIVVRHGFQFCPAHEALWPWEEIEAAVVSAFATALGVELDVIHDRPGQAAHDPW